MRSLLRTYGPVLAELAVCALLTLSLTAGLVLLCAYGG